MFCPGCGTETPSTARYCCSCGAALDSTTATLDEKLGSEGETIAPPTPPRASHVPVSPPRSSRSSSSAMGSPSSSDALGGRFTPGQIIADRYRIVALAGRGGMGEVYRAEDLKLSQIVAIKFLPESVSKDAAALARFHDEVRIARTVSHPN